MKKCENCENFCYDYTTGTTECARYDMTEEESERYYVNDEENCPYWE